MKKNLHKKNWVTHIFHDDGGWWKELLLFPLLGISWIYRVIIGVRKALYQRGFFKTRQKAKKLIKLRKLES